MYSPYIAPSQTLTQAPNCGLLAAINQMLCVGVNYQQILLSLMTFLIADWNYKLTFTRWAVFALSMQATATAAVAVATGGGGKINWLPWWTLQFQLQ